jgi:UDP-N-acetylmuramate: L-alanyl-gamma-D-glutamyl-meso-diaminopimelate ligase
MLSEVAPETAPEVSAESRARLARIPATIRHIHLIGVAGSAMAALAGMLSARGYRVTGSDNQLYEPTASLLKGLRIDIRHSYDAANLAPAPDLVVVGNVVPRANREAQALLASSIAYLSMPEALWHLFLRDRRVLMVAGTHGKTTSTAMMAHVLEAAGRDPSMLVGGVARDFGTNYRLGSGRDFVIEGDEYDTAFFDKGPKFLHYRANGAIITAVEFDHADIYRDLDHVKSSFRALATQMDQTRTAATQENKPATLTAQDKAAHIPTAQEHDRVLATQGNAARVIVVCADFPHALEVSAAARARRLTFGLKAGEFRATDIAIGPFGARFSIERDGARIATNLELPIGGRMNVANALGVWVLLREFGLGDDELAHGLKTFAGVKRRQEMVGEARGIAVIDDFAHHPTAITATLEALAERYAGRRILAAFEPRSNTARRSVFQHGFAAAFDRAARVYLGAVYFKENDPLLPADRLDTDALASAIAARGPVASCFATTDAILERIAADAQPGDVVVCMSNGPFDGLPQRLLTALT